MNKVKFKVKLKYYDSKKYNNIYFFNVKKC